MSKQIMNLSEWRLPSKSERLEHIEKFKSRVGEISSSVRIGSLLVFRNKIRPVDMYAYLKTRFGPPNGMQTFLRKDDSDNLFHWDYNIKCGEVDIYIVGATREIHFFSSAKMNNKDWPFLVRALKRDFRNFGRQKSDVIKSFEKWVIFENKFATLADVCADLHAKIVDAPSFNSFKYGKPVRRQSRFSNRDAKLASKRAVDLHGDCLKLRLLTPIMAEAFINLFILAFCKKEVRNDEILYQSFIREKLPQKIRLPHAHCNFLMKPIDEGSDSYAAFFQMINKRNDLIHGNMNPIKDQIEVVYFEGKRPLLYETGDHIGHFFDKLEELYNPSSIVADYVSTHLFLMDIANCLHLKFYEWFRNVWSDPYPGYEMRQQRITRLFPSYVVAMKIPGVIYDDQLQVEW